MEVPVDSTVLGSRAVRPGDSWICGNCDTAGGRAVLTRYRRPGCTICRELNHVEVLTLKMKALYGEAYRMLIRDELSPFFALEPLLAP